MHGIVFQKNDTIHRYVKRAVPSTWPNAKPAFSNINYSNLGIGAQGGWGGIKVDPPSKILTKLVNKNAMKHK